MNDVKYSTEEEKRLIKAIQKAIGAYDNGIIGTQTLTDIANGLNADYCPDVWMSDDNGEEYSSV